MESMWKFIGAAATAVVLIWVVTTISIGAYRIYKNRLLRKDEELKKQKFPIHLTN